MGKYFFQKLLDAVETTTSSGEAGVAGFKKVGFQLKSANISSGNGVFRFQGSVDGETWTYLNVIDNLANTNAQTLTRVGTKTLSTNEKALVWLDEDLPLRAVRVHVTVTTDGSYSCTALASE